MNTFRSEFTQGETIVLFPKGRILVVLIICFAAVTSQLQAQTVPGGTGLDACSEFFTRPFETLTNPYVGASLNENDLNIDAIQEGFGPYHYDFHQVTVRLPPSLNPSGILQQMAYNLNGFIGPSSFDDHVIQITRNPSGEARVGDIYTVDLKFASLGIDSPENALVMLTDIQNDHYTLVTLQNPNVDVVDDLFRDHPTPGVREYGFITNADGTLTFYTSGASRAGNIPIPDPQPLQNAAWSAMMQGLTKKLESLGGQVVTPPSMQELELDEPLPCTGALDIVFVIDTTGSMEDDISRVKADAITIITQVSNSSSSWRIAVTTFRDHPIDPYGDSGDYVVREEIGFSTDAPTISSAIQRITVAGGGDTPEAVCSAIQNAVHAAWRSEARRIIILMGDAPAHDPEPISGCSVRDVMTEAYAGDREHVYPILISNSLSAARSFATFADASSGRVFSAETAAEVVPALLNTISYASDAELVAGETALVAADTVLNLRSGPGKEFDVVEKMQPGTVVTLGEGVEFVYPYIWHEVETDSGTTGWAVEGADGQATLVSASAREITEATTGPCLLTAEGTPTNVRYGPGTGTVIIRELAPGDSVEAIGQTRSNVGFLWWKIQGGGWVRDDAVSRTGACLILPAATP